MTCCRICGPKRLGGGLEGWRGETDPRNTQPHPARQADNDDRREALYVTSEKSGGGTKKKKKKKKFADGKHC